MRSPSGKKRADLHASGPLTTTILAFDSCSKLRRVNEELVNPIREYLAMQWVHETGGESVDYSNVPLVKMRTPQQRNDYDCGLFVLRMCEEVAKVMPSIDMFRMYASKTGLQMKYVKAFTYKQMKAYRNALKNAVMKMSKEHGRWLDEWETLM